MRFIQFLESVEPFGKIFVATGQVNSHVLLDGSDKKVAWYSIEPGTEVKIEAEVVLRFGDEYIAEIVKQPGIRVAFYKSDFNKFVTKDEWNKRWLMCSLLPPDQ
jgi:hypothetical protein